MPVTWTIDADRKFMAVVAEGAVTRDDLERFIDAIRAANTMAFRKLFDGTRATPQMTAEDFLAIGGRIRRYHEAAGEIGPLAVVLSEETMALVDRVVGMLAVADRPMKVFTSLDDARRWINRKALTRPKRTSVWRNPGRPKKTEPSGEV